MEKSLTLRRFSILIICMRVCGIPVFMEKRTKSYLAYQFIMYFCTFTTLGASWLHVFLVEKNLKEFLATVRVSLACSTAVWMDLYFKLNMKTVEHLMRFTEQFTWEELPPRDPETKNITAAGATLMMPKILKYLAIATIIIHILQTAYRIITQHEMIFPTWYPYEQILSPAYEITNISQVLASISFETSFFSFIGLYSFCVGVACSQFYKMKPALLKISGKEDLSEMQEKLKICIKHHQKVLQYLDELELAFNKGICVVLLLQMATVCLTAFSIVISWEDFTDLVQGFAIYLIFISSICVICWAGNQLTESAESVKEAAFDMNWIGAPITFQRSIQLIITRTNKEFTLTAGKFGPVNNKTMVNILNQTWSLFLFLLEMKNKRRLED